MARKASEKGRIDVIVRKRPLSEQEISRGDKDIVVCNYDSAIIREFKYKIDGTSFIEEHEFKVDRFYDEKADNELIYNEYVKPLVESAFREGKTCSCFTYGQTGSGKTYTMIGSKIDNGNNTNNTVGDIGIYEYAANDIYEISKEPQFNGKVEVVVSFYEIYCGKLYDLLQNRKLLESLDNGKNEVVIKDLSERVVSSKEELVDLMLEALNLRKIGQNSQNDRSSRSHALLRIELRHLNNTIGSMLFIDLAGSERAADSVSMCRQVQIDGAGINRSLLALKECIRAMDLDRIHIPFRNSELTKVLRDVFMGDSRNVMIANICPSFQSCEQTLNTLRYATKVKAFKSNSLNTTMTLNTLNTINSANYSTKDTINKENGISKGASIKSRNSKRSSPMDYEPRLSNDKMDLDPLNSNNTGHTTLNALNTNNYNNKDTIVKDTTTSVNDEIAERVEGMLKSQNDEMIREFESILNSLQLNNTNSHIFKFLTGSNSPNPNNPNNSSAIKLYTVYNRTMSVLNNNVNSIEDVKDRLKISFKFLLYLKQLLDRPT
ncbi:kinesin-like protein, putative [Theileria annulata]|uniref:Kinesin-like protein n=1 Tax=Theileria annulata TaxID=5874 RepID=Q4UF42_THEAN|nr:kinesin-like protein, putative [Theileria annulata]CAI74297.1 kinesin-like protein, putative [Theileria annulata]|eukprot:XP_952029.1 kinesin-like protein, putative [Theileria annulata]